MRHSPINRAFRIFLLTFSLLASLTACVTPSQPAPTPDPNVSAWGAIITLAQTEQTSAPAIALNGGGGLVAAWIGSDQRGVHQDIRGWNINVLSESVTLPLPPIHPYAQQSALAANANFHLLWLDADENGATQVYGALVDSDLQLLRGPTKISDKAVWNFAIEPIRDGSLWVIAGGGPPSEPTLTAYYLDPTGRPRVQQTAILATDADWPTLAHADDGTTLLYWIRPSDGQIFASPIIDNTLLNPQPVMLSLPLNPGDRLDNFSAGFDRTHAYLFWNVTRANGTHESWFASAERATNAWSAPAQLKLNTALADPFETGFNTGNAHIAAPGTSTFSWASPLDGEFDALPIAGVIDGTHLVTLYLRGGQIAGLQDVVTVSQLLGAPAIRADRDRHLYLAWSEPTADGVADLRLTTTRR